MSLAESQWKVVVMNSEIKISWIVQMIHFTYPSNTSRVAIFQATTLACNALARCKYGLTQQLGTLWNTVWWLKSFICLDCLNLKKSSGMCTNGQTFLFTDRFLPTASEGWGPRYMFSSLSTPVEGGVHRCRSGPDRGATPAKSSHLGYPPSDLAMIKSPLCRDGLPHLG